MFFISLPFCTVCFFIPLSFHTLCFCYSSAFLYCMFFIPLPFCTVCFFNPLPVCTVCFYSPAFLYCMFFYSPAFLHCMFFYSPAFLYCMFFYSPAFLHCMFFYSPAFLFCMFFSPLSFVGLPLCILLSNWYFRLRFSSNYSSFPNEKSFHSSRQGWGSFSEYGPLFEPGFKLPSNLAKIYEKTSSKIKNLFHILWLFSQKRLLPCQQFKTVLYKKTKPQDLDPDTNFEGKARSGSGSV